ncbi:hypothetical protein TcasGA2_TC001472 [Tribolium castaneum]|uniref:Uncharacterized protein n=1 Tax=Tribolium castaneum TaxID=7070 RepID=D7GYB0_TRICA|nr:hypothetical protein TcasGA2_TC001472 [Tribolium castaneum]
MERDPLDLISILISKPEIITAEYKCTNLTPVLFTKQRPTLFTELVLEANCNKKTNIKSKVTVIAYEEIENKKIGSQHIMYTTQPGSISDSSSSADLLEDDDSNSNQSLTRKRKRRTCQKAGDFELLGHEDNCQFNNTVKCQVEILILVGDRSYCETLAKHLGLIWLEGLLKGEEAIERRLQNYDNKIYRLAHTEIIKKMMNGYSSICITTSTSAWKYISACTKGIIYTKNKSNLYKQLQTSANYCVFVEDNIVAYVDAISKIVQKSLLCNILVEANYQVDEKAYTKIKLPITVLIPLYIVKYFSQSFMVTHGTWANSKILDIFERRDIV